MLKAKAFAKINLCLRVGGKRQDGYHEIDSIMQSVSLCDFVSLFQCNCGIGLSIDDPTLPINNKNTAHKAAEHFFNKTKIKPSVRIEIQKHIPVGAGLAGGSADAAAVLIGLNQLYKTNLTVEELRSLGQEVGSDVPFCIIGGLCRCRGRGEIVEKLQTSNASTRLRRDLDELGRVAQSSRSASRAKSRDLKPQKWFVIVKPDFSVSTKWVYENYDPLSVDQKRQCSIDEPFNDLENVVLENYPEIGQIKKRLIELGCKNSLMSGSGSSVFGVTDDHRIAQNVFAEMKKQYKQVFAAEPVNCGVEVLQ